MSKTEAEKRIGLERFLQLEPQKRGIMAILRSRFATEIYTRAEWETIVTNVLHRTVK